MNRGIAARAWVTPLYCALTSALLLSHLLWGQEKSSLDKLVSPAGRHCGPARNPKKPPPVGQIVDSAQVHEALLAVAGVPAGAKVLMTIAFEKEGTLDRASVLDADVPDAEADSVLGMVLKDLQPQKKSDEVWATRLRLTLGSGATEATEKAVFCTAEPIGGKGDRLITDDRIYLSSEDRQRLDPEWRHGFPPIDVIVGTDGRAKDVHLRSKSGVLQLDDMVQGIARNMHYEPALIDGLAVEAPYQLDLR
jgi:hypothetical protein